MQIEFSMTSIAALLTVIGYSMNEKVITFDRLRENLRKYRRTPLAEVINLSENERLSRTIITGATALLALGGMLFAGRAVPVPAGLHHGVRHPDRHLFLGLCGAAGAADLGRQARRGRRQAGQGGDGEA